MTICWFLFGQAEESYKSLPRPDFGSRSPDVPHLEVNSPRCSDVNEVRAIGSIGSVLGSGRLVVEVDFCVFRNVVREARGHRESRTISRARPRPEVDSAVEVTRQPDSHVGGRSRGNLKVEGTSMGGHWAALSRRWSTYVSNTFIDGGVLTTLALMVPSSLATCMFIR